MQFTTPIDITPSTRPICYRDRVLLLGSCFSDEIGRQMQMRSLPALTNPSGTLYNPISILSALRDDEPVRRAFAAADVVLITLGTAWVYERDGRVVANCQKLPASLFTRRRLSVDEIVSAWQPFLIEHAAKRWIFTVSPIRHRKDGLHENELSKAILLLAVERLGVEYFPSYEILLDELRDYRFYGDDLAHPSHMAVEYIFSRFSDTYYAADTRAQMADWLSLYADEHHRLLHPDSEEAKRFLEQTRRKRAALEQRYAPISYAI